MKKQNMPKITLETIDRKLDSNFGKIDARFSRAEAGLTDLSVRLDDFIAAVARGFAIVTSDMRDFEQRVDFRFSRLESRIDRVSDLEIES